MAVSWRNLTDLLETEKKEWGECKISELCMRVPRKFGKTETYPSGNNAKLEHLRLIKPTFRNPHYALAILWWSQQERGIFTRSD